MRLVRTELVDSREILPGQWLQAFHAPELATGSRAGQFVHVRTGDLSGLVLRRPFSINTADPATGTITIHFRTIGRGTEWFTQLRSGDMVDMLGPLGRPFEVDSRSRHLLLIAGGLGMAGIRSLADEAIRDGRQVTLLFGAASARDVYPSSLLPDVTPGSGRRFSVGAQNVRPDGGNAPQTRGDGDRGQPPYSASSARAPSARAAMRAAASSRDSPRTSR